VGGAHRDPAGAAASLEEWIVDQLEELRELSTEELIERRFDRFRNMGAFEELALVEESEVESSAGEVELGAGAEPESTAGEG
jgi:hypothetical protein